MAASGFPRNDWEVHSLYTFAGTSMWARPRHRGRVGTLAMLLRIARALPSATPALLRARPLVGRAVPAAVAASVGACVASSVAAPAFCMLPPLEPDELAEQLDIGHRGAVRNTEIRGMCAGGPAN